MYSFLRDLLFNLDPELSHDFSLDMIGAVGRLRLLKLFVGELPDCPKEVMGIRFPNPVGLAAGLDKNADFYKGLGDLGFGFVEVGTVTPKPQPGNPEPRMFRLAPEKAIINRMGFNNKGVDHLVERVKKKPFAGVLGINIGKNKLTPEDCALNDYQICMEKVYPYADYITVNISSPNTPGLRDLQFGEQFDHLLKGIKTKQAELADEHNSYVPIAVKIAPDMDEVALTQVAEQLLEHKIDGVIATNTTVDRSGVQSSAYRDEPGGLSGAPLTLKSTETIRQLASIVDGRIPIIGVGGIMSGGDAVEKIKAGASLVQLYTGFIYQGPSLIRSAVESINAYEKACS